MTSDSEVQALMTQAVDLHRHSKLDEAAELYQQILSSSPSHAEAMHLLGVTRAQQGQFKQATELIEESLRFAPENARAWANLGHTWLQSGNPYTAVSALDRALVHEPNYPRARLWLAQALQNGGQPYAALQSCQQLVQFNPGMAEAWQTLVRMLADICQFSQALQLLDKAMQILPSPAPLQTLHQQIVREQSVHQKWLEQQLGPVGARDKLALLDLLHAHFNRHNLQEAIRVGHTLVARNPTDIEAYMLLGRLWNSCQQPLSAIECFDRVTSLSPGHVQAHFECGLALYGLRKDEEALEQFDMAIQNDGHHVDSLYMRASTLLQLKRFEESIQGFIAVEEVSPDYPQLQGELLSALLSTANWTQLEFRRHKLLLNLKEQKSPTQPFFALHLTDDPHIQLQAARHWSNYVANHLPKPVPVSLTSDILRRKRIRVGYFSMDFREHPVSYLTAGLFEAHNREHFEIHIFDYGPRQNDAMQQRIRAAADHYHLIEQTPLSVVVNSARSLQLDIAVDLAGFTAHARPDLFQQRLAPAQISYLGYPGTSGAPWMDYIIGDAWVTPQIFSSGYSEQLIELPFFQVNDDKRKISDRKFSRQELGLPDNHLIYCCLNSTQKINPEIFAIWLRILFEVPDSSLLLLSDDSSLEARLRSEAQCRGIAPSRLVFVGRLSAPDYLARYRAADLFLDTFPFNAGTTASDALWAGLPVLTCSGKAYASRMAGSLLHNLGLPELVTESLSDYEQVAIRLGNDRHQLSSLRERLEERRLTADAFNTARMTSWIEQAYVQLVARARAGLPPTHIRISPVDKTSLPTV